MPTTLAQLARPEVGQLVAIAARNRMETRFGLARITHIERTPDDDGWYITWTRADSSRIGTAGSAHMPGRGPFGITAMPVETNTCIHCHQTIHTDPYDSRGNHIGLLGDVVWRSKDQLGVCEPDRWHQPASPHVSRCSWLVRCPEHQL
jgi:hypothetical protein